MRCIELGPCHLDDDVLEDALDLAHLSPEKTLLFEARSILPDDLNHIERLLFILQLLPARMS